MTQNPPQQQPCHSLSTANAAVKGCYNCNSDDHWILHNIKFRDEECRKLCTSCVLKQHPTSFCPLCFNLFDPRTLNPSHSSSSSSSSSSSYNRTLTCLKCKSVSHITCIPAKTPKSPYLCPPCSNPSFKFFDLKKHRKNRDQPPSDGGCSSGGDVGSTKIVEEMKQYIDDKAAKVFLLAATISAMSMSKAASILRSDAERKATDAALARKRAKEAIDHVVVLTAKYGFAKQPKKDVLASGSKPSYEPVKMETNGGMHNVGGSGAGNGNGSVAVVPGPQSNGGGKETAA